MNNKQFKQWLHQFSFNEVPRPFQKPLLMGILNVTPDSFSDGGMYIEPEIALQKARELIAAGVDIIDIGGESSRPGAESVSIEEELSRVIPVIQSIRRESSICMSVDTYKPEVMREALGAGANMINDITALQHNDSIKTAIEYDAPVCLMHMLGAPKTMQTNPQYQRTIDEINQFFARRIRECLAYGMRQEQLILDPGFGFGKTVHHNLLLTKYLGDFKTHCLPLLLGVSRKSTIGAILNKSASNRLYGSLALSVWASIQGVAILRTHDVDETRQAVEMIEAMMTVTDDRSSEVETHGAA